MDMAFQRSTCIRDALLAMYREAAAKMSAYPRLPDGSTPDAIKATPEWGKNKEAFVLLFLGLAPISGTSLDKLGKKKMFRPTVKTNC